MSSIVVSNLNGVTLVYVTAVAPANILVVCVIVTIVLAAIPQSKPWRDVAVRPRVEPVTRCRGALVKGSRSHAVNADTGAGASIACTLIIRLLPIPPAWTVVDAVATCEIVSCAVCLRTGGSGWERNGPLVRANTGRNAARFSRSRKDVFLVHHDRRSVNNVYDYMLCGYVPLVSEH